MPSSSRYTVRLPPALDALVQARVRAGTPFAVLIRDALSAYLAEPPPPGLLISADSADLVHDLGEQLALLRTRVESLEQVLTRRRQSANSGADITWTPANTTGSRPPLGQYKLTARQVASLRAKRARGTPIKALMEEFGISKATVFRYLK